MAHHFQPGTLGWVFGNETQTGDKAMATDYIIHDEQIAARLKSISYVAIEWTGAMPTDADEWDDAADEKSRDVTVADVRSAMRHDLNADTPDGYLDMAILIACEPLDMPEGGVVVVEFDN